MLCFQLVNIHFARKKKLVSTRVITNLMTSLNHERNTVISTFLLMGVFMTYKCN